MSFIDLSRQAPSARSLRLPRLDNLGYPTIQPSNDPATRRGKGSTRSLTFQQK
jgi:hypothetical protein